MRFEPRGLRRRTAPCPRGAVRVSRPTVECAAARPPSAAPSLRAFHHDAHAVARWTRGWLRLYTLSLDDTLAAVMYGFARDGRFYFYQHGFDAAYANYSAGLALMALTIRAAIDGWHARIRHALRPRSLQEPVGPRSSARWHGCICFPRAWPVVAAATRRNAAGPARAGPPALAEADQMTSRNRLPRWRWTPQGRRWPP